MRRCERERSSIALKRFPPTDPREWLNRARSNLALARADATGALREDLCFEAQQVAEKAIKAVYVHRGAPFPFIHDLDRLLQILEQSGVKIPRYVKDFEGADPLCRGDALSRNGGPRQHAAIPPSSAHCGGRSRLGRTARRKALMRHWAQCADFSDLDPMH